MITLDLLRLLRFRKAFSASWMRKEWHRRGLPYEGVSSLLVSMGAVERSKDGMYRWIEDVDEVEIAEKQQILMVCMTDYDFIDFATSHTYTQAYAITDTLRCKSAGGAIKQMANLERVVKKGDVVSLDGMILEIVKNSPGISPSDVARLFPDRTYGSIYCQISRMDKWGLVDLVKRSSGYGCSKVFPKGAVE